MHIIHTISYRNFIIRVTHCVNELSWGLSKMEKVEILSLGSSKLSNNSRVIERKFKSNFKNFPLLRKQVYLQL